MSTILKTLKKLEEEKSVLEQNHDIRGMVTKVEVGVSGTSELDRCPFGLVVFSLLAIACFGALWGYLDKDFSKQEPVQAKALAGVSAETQSNTLPESRGEQVSGIPMMGIPERSAVVRKIAASQKPRKIERNSAVGLGSAIDNKSVSLYL